jgi:trans-aconitate methyltransferase
MTLSDAVALIDTSLLKSSPAAAALPPQTWADLGCGSGLFSQALSQFLPAGSTIYGIDLHPTLQPQAAPVHFIPRQLNFVTAGLGLENLDGILMANSLHYVAHQPAFIRRIQSYLTSQHTLLIVEYDTDRPTPTWVPYPLSMNSLRSLLQNAGYTSVEKIGQRPSAFGRSYLYSALARRL